MSAIQYMELILHLLSVSYSIINTRFVSVAAPVLLPVHKQAHCQFLYNYSVIFPCVHASASQWHLLARPLTISCFPRVLHVHPTDSQCLVTHYKQSLHIVLPFAPDISIYCEQFQCTMEEKQIALRQEL